MALTVMCICSAVDTTSASLTGVDRPAQEGAQKQRAEPPSPSEIIRRGLLEGNNYLGPLLELREREAEYLASARRKTNYYDYLAQLSSYVGDFEGLYASEEKFLEMLEPRIGRRKGFAKELTSSPIDTYRPRSALDAITSAADTHQVIMINEEHRTPLHRALTLRLLPALYAKGFRYFAVETVNTTDTELNGRGYPTQRTGTYTADPVFGDLIRTALKIGFKIVPYDPDNLDCTPKPDNPMWCDDERERIQAQNIVDRILKKDPGAKVLAHVGRDHNAETREEFIGPMAWHFKAISGIDPFTVDQLLSERRNPADEEPIYRYVTRKWGVAEPTVFLSPEGSFWKGATGHDLKVFHPRARYEMGRPTWLRLGGLRRPRPIDLKKLNLPAGRQKFGGREPALVQAFVSGESPDAVPVDQVVVYPGREIPALMLPKGSLRIRAIDRAGKVVGEYRTSLK
jgi:hypothetical protein